jgi:hypothetical protein
MCVSSFLSQYCKEYEGMTGPKIKDQRSKTKELKIKENNEKGKKCITESRIESKRFLQGTGRMKKREERQNRKRERKREYTGFWTLRVLGDLEVTK